MDNKQVLRNDMFLGQVYQQTPAGNQMILDKNIEVSGDCTPGSWAEELSKEAMSCRLGPCDYGGILIE